MSQLSDDPSVTSCESLTELAEQLESATHRCRERPDDPQLRREAWDLLDRVRMPACLARIDREHHPAWSARMLDLIVASNFTVGSLLRHRAERYGDKILFEVETARPRR